MASFIEKRMACDHFRGEISGEVEIDHARNLSKQLDWYCKGTGQALMHLKNKYANDPRLLQKLDVYEEKIEFNDYNPDEAMSDR